MHMFVYKLANSLLFLCCRTHQVFPYWTLTWPGPHVLSRSLC